MNKGNKTNEIPRKLKIVDFLGNLSTFFLGIVISIWSGIQILDLVQLKTATFFQYIVYVVLDILCFIGVVSIGKKMWRDIFRKRHD